MRQKEKAWKDKQCCNLMKFLVCVTNSFFLANLLQNFFLLNFYGMQERELSDKKNTQKL